MPSRAPRAPPLEAPTPAAWLLGAPAALLQLVVAAGHYAVKWALWLGCSPALGVRREAQLWAHLLSLAMRGVGGGSAPVAVRVENGRDAAEAAALLRRDGCVVLLGAVGDVGLLERCACECTHAAAAIVAAQGSEGNRGRRRYCFGEQLARYCPSLPDLLASEAVAATLRALWGTDDFAALSIGGDFTLPGCLPYQPLHSDMAWLQAGKATPPVATVNFAMEEVTAQAGPVRFVRGTHRFRPPLSGVLHSSIMVLRVFKRQTPACVAARRLLESLATVLSSLESALFRARVATLAPMPLGAAVVRDPRTWHGGTPNTTADTLRALPHVMYAPGSAAWSDGQGAQRCIPAARFDAMPEAAQRRARHCRAAGQVACEAPTPDKATLRVGAVGALH